MIIILGIVAYIAAWVFTSFVFFASSCGCNYNVYENSVESEATTCVVFAAFWPLSLPFFACIAVSGLLIKGITELIVFVHDKVKK